MKFRHALIGSMLGLASTLALAQTGAGSKPGHDMNEANQLDPKMRVQMEKERKQQAGSGTQPGAPGQTGHDMNDHNRFDPKMRAQMEKEWKKRADKDGTVNKKQFMNAMEGHWHTLEKRHGHSGKVKAEDMPRIMMFMSGQDTAP